jgi:hypothetical protein
MARGGAWIGRKGLTLTFKPAVQPRSPDESFWLRGIREAKKRFESWTFGLIGFLGSAAVAALADPETGLVCAVTAVTLVLGWSVVVTGIAQRDEARAALKVRERADSTTRPRGPQLEFGVAEIPRRTRKVWTSDLRRVAMRGRIIKVPVTNALGAGEALHVNARLHFLSGNQTNDYEPITTQGEWSLDGDRDRYGVAITLVGNGQPHFLAVTMVLDRDYPHAHEWTARSRAALLDGYGIEADEFDVTVEVQGIDANGNPVQIFDTLRIACRPGDVIKADWMSTLGNVATNLVVWQKTCPNRVV